jgi:hypothetical protein
MVELLVWQQSASDRVIFVSHFVLFKPGYQNHSAAFS